MTPATATPSPGWRPWTATASTAEVLYSEVSAFRSFGLVKGDWRPISRAFTDLSRSSPPTTRTGSSSPTRCRSSTSTTRSRRSQRLAGLGARSVHLPNFPSEFGLPDYHDERYDPLWGVLQETGISISHHLGNRPWLYDVFRRDPTPQMAIFTSMPALALSEVDRLVDPHRHARALPRAQDRLRRAQPLLDPRLPRQLDRKAGRVPTTSPACG